MSSLFGKIPKKELSQALKAAVESGDQEALSVALAAGADAAVVLDQYCARGNVNLICVAAHENQAEVLEPLVGAGACLDHREAGYGHTALHIAAIEGHPEVLQELVYLGLNVNTADNDGDTAIHYAALNGHLRCVERLLKLKANIYARNNCQQTPLMYAAVDDKVTNTHC
ncbi:unnamed protein product, partial [Meganyctiphanes norvegica]